MQTALLQKSMVDGMMSKLDQLRNAAAAERIAKLESEIEARKAEIDRLQIGAHDGRDDSKNHSLLKSLRQEHRASCPPSIVCASSFCASSLDSDDTSLTSNETESTLGPRSPLPPLQRCTNVAIVESGDIPIEDSEPQVDVLVKMLEERDQVIEALTAAMPEAELKQALAGINKQRESGSSTSGAKASQAEEEEWQDVTLEIKCAMLQNMVADLEIRSSDQENVIEMLKTKMIKLLITKKCIEEELRTEIERRDQSYSTLERSSKERADESKRTISDLELFSSLLEDQIEKLKVENVRLQLQSQVRES
jgi:hypothetical protein